MAAPTTALETLSKLLFNAQHRLAVARVFLGDPAAALTCDDVAGGASISRSVAHKELHVLTTIGAVQRVEVHRNVYFQRVSSGFWVLCEELLVANQHADTHVGAR